MTTATPVLLVEDDARERARIAGALAGVCTLLVARTHRDALRLASAHAPGVIVLGAADAGPAEETLARIREITPARRALFLVDDTSSPDALRLSRAGVILRRGADDERVRAAVQGAVRFTAMRAGVRMLMNETGRFRFSSITAPPEAAATAPRILVVDDDEAIRSSLCELLRDAGYQVDAASNGLEALRAMRGHAGLPGLVLLDMAMPVMDGLAFLDQKQLDPRLSPVAVAVITGGEPTDRAALIKRGVTARMRKPLDLERLLSEVERACPVAPPPA